jgi:hypothetical protein
MGSRPGTLRAAGVPDEVGFATKPRLAMAMLERAMAARVPSGWVTADEAYGQVKYLRVWLGRHDCPHVLASRRNDTLITTDGLSGGEQRADTVIAGLPTRSWRQLSVGAGAHGPRIYDWAPDPDPRQLGTRAWVLAAGPALGHSSFELRACPLSAAYVRLAHRCDHCPSGRSNSMSS